MKKEERMNGLATELLNEAAKDQNKKCATIILSSFDVNDGENTGCITAACGTVIGMATVLTVAMQKNEHLKEAIMMAAGLGGIMGGDSPSSSFPFGLAALLGGIGK